MLFSIRKAAKILDVDQKTVKKAIKKGQIKTIELGDRKLIPKAELEKFLNP